MTRSWKRTDTGDLESALSRVPAPAPSPIGACPDAVVIAAVVERTAGERERSAFEEHAAACDNCRRVAAALVRTRESAADRGSKLGRWAVAASILVLAAIGWRVLAHDAPSAIGERDLVAGGETLARERPELFSGFDALAWRARSLPNAPVERADDCVPIYPQGRILEDRPRFVWRAPAGSAAVGIRVTTADGTPLFAIANARAPQPFPATQAALPRGARYAWTVAPDTANGPRAGRTFECAAETERTDFEAALSAIEARFPADQAWLLQVCYALDRGFPAAVVDRLDAYLERHADDAIALEAQARMRSILGGLGRLGSEARAPAPRSP